MRRKQKENECKQAASATPGEKGTKTGKIRTGIPHLKNCQNVTKSLTILTDLL
jgi:hypothetical protein